MSVNPLFSGPVPNKRPPIYNSASPGQRRANILRQTNINSGNMNVRDSPAPRKRPRIGETETTNDSDPFHDFDSFTEDDLESFDMIASQALSQQPHPELRPPTHTLKRPASAPKFPNQAKTNLIPPAPYSQTVNKSSIVNNTQPSSSSGSLQQSHASVGNASSKFSFKSTNSRGGRPQAQAPSGLANRTPTPTFPQAQSTSHTRQSNITGTKIYYSSQYHSGSTPPGSHQQAENLASTKTQTLPSNRVTGPHKHTIQSNVGAKITNSSTSTFPARSTLQNLHIDTSSRSNPVPYNTKPGAISNNSNMGAGFHSVPPQGGGRSTASLTPPKGAIARESPGLPSTERDTGSSQIATLQQQQVAKYKSECETIKKQLELLTKEMFSKEGEIQVLRQNLNKSKVETSRLQMERLQAEEQRKQQLSEVEREFKKENESLKTQLQFKEVELMQAQSASQNHRTRPPISSGLNHAPTTPTKQTATPPASKTEDDIRDTDMFPTQQSFMADNRKVERGQLRSPRVRTLSEGQPARSSPKRSPRRGLASKSPGKVSPSVLNSIPASSSSSSIPYGKPPRNAKKSSLVSDRLQKASSAEAQLIGILLEDTEKQATTAGSVGGLMGLVQSTGYDRVPPSDGMEAAIPGQPLPAKPQKVSPNKRQLIHHNENSSNRSVELATKAISNILNPPRIPPLPPNVARQVPPYRPPTGKSQDLEFEDPVACITDLLPLMEDQLTCYIDTTHSITQNNAPALCSTCPSSSSGGGSGGRSLESSLDSPGSSSPSEELMALGRAESAVLTSLTALGKMVTCSPTVRTVILHAGTYKDPESPGSDEDVSAMEIDPSAPLIDPTQAPSKSAGHSSVVHEPQPPQPPTDSFPDRRSNHILSKLMRIASMQHGLGNCGAVVESSVYLLRIIVQKSNKEEYEKLQSLLVHDALFNAMCRDSTFTQVSHALDIVKALSSSWKLTCKLCNQSDSCLLLQCYQCGVHGSQSCSNPQKVQLTVKVISILWRIIGTHHQGPTMLLDADCQCSLELVSAVVLMLRRMLNVMQLTMSYQHPTQYWRYVLHEGLLVLHCLAMHDRNFTDHRLDVEKVYVALITALNKLYHRLPDATDNETGLVQDLWDFVHWDETEWELEEEDDENEDEQQGVAKMEME
ncbi:uncharacterized protein LOC119726756 [Patiria miniata]|uniref:ATR-interacting protein n=1 Tax=Patiria miniata TaxID=46514 RepID=A0A913ZTX3_PATMI|nr:uncharacterized protein LOC119726756 [Patiria miniata]